MGPSDLEQTALKICEQKWVGLVTVSWLKRFSIDRFSISRK